MCDMCGWSSRAGTEVRGHSGHNERCYVRREIMSIIRHIRNRQPDFQRTDTDQEVIVSLEHIICACNFKLFLSNIEKTNQSNQGQKIK